MEDLSELIVTTRVKKPIAMVLHSEHGVGKTTFGTKAPAPVYITGEEIEEIQDVGKFPKCESWEDFLKYLMWVKNGKHKYKTLVIDTLDSIESLLWKHIIQNDKAEDMAVARGGFGKAYIYATQLFTEMRDKYLVPIRDKRKMHIILLCHTAKIKFEDPMTQSSYDVFEMKIHKNAKGIGAYKVFSEWVTVIAFANIERFTVKDKKSDKEYAVGEGVRQMFCSPQPSHDAKNRYNLEPVLPMEWSAIEAGYDKFFKVNKNGEALALQNEIYALVEKIEDEKARESTLKNVKSVGDDIERLKKAKEYIQGVVK